MLRSRTACPICWEFYDQASSKTIITMDCGHVLHQGCLMNWCKNHGNVSTINGEEHLVNAKCFICSHDIQDFRTLRPSFVDESISDEVSREIQDEKAQWKQEQSQLSQQIRDLKQQLENITEFPVPALPDTNPVPKSEIGKLPPLDSVNPIADIRFGDYRILRYQKGSKYFFSGWQLFGDGMVYSLAKKIERMNETNAIAAKNVRTSVSVAINTTMTNFNTNIQTWSKVEEQVVVSMGEADLFWLPVDRANMLLVQLIQILVERGARKICILLSLEKPNESEKLRNKRKKFNECISSSLKDVFQNVELIDATPINKCLERMAIPRKFVYDAKRYFIKAEYYKLINLDKLPEYLRDTVDWFIGKARRRDKELCADEPKFYLEESVLENKLPEITFRSLIELPSGLDYNEWLASHTIAIFDNVNLMYGTISEFCTATGCPDMVGPGLRTYLWFDDKGKKTRVSAPQYVDYVMTFTQKTINDEAVFPTKYPHEFPTSFETIVRKILRLLFHVLAHLYHSHFREIALLNLHSHLNSVFTHLIILNDCYHLIDDRELEILFDLVNALKILETEGTASKSTESARSSVTNGCLSEGSSVLPTDKQVEASSETVTKSSEPFASYSDPNSMLPATSYVANDTSAEVLTSPNF